MTEAVGAVQDSQSKVGNMMHTPQSPNHAQALLPISLQHSFHKVSSKATCGLMITTMDVPSEIVDFSYGVTLFYWVEDHLVKR